MEGRLGMVMKPIGGKGGGCLSGPWRHSAMCQQHQTFAVQTSALCLRHKHLSHHHPSLTSLLSTSSPPPSPPPPSPSFHRSRSSTTFSLYPCVFVGLEPSPPPTRILCPRAPPDFSEWGAWLVSLSLFIQVAQQVEETCCCSGPVWNQGFVQDLTCYCSVYSSDLLTTADLYITPFETFVLIQVCVT